MLFSIYDVDGSGALDYNEFKNAVFSGRPATGQSRPGTGQSGPAVGGGGARTME
jgi:hypothetical protein